MEMEIDADGDLVVARRPAPDLVRRVAASFGCSGLYGSLDCSHGYHSAGDAVAISSRLACRSPPPLPPSCLPQPPSEELVLSEVHMESLRPSPGTSAVATFTDAAGQPVVSVQHSMATPLRSVGLQVWRGALLLADLLLHRGAAAFKGATALELGAGAGLAGLVLSRFADAVYLTGKLQRVVGSWALPVFAARCQAAVAVQVVCSSCCLTNNGSLLWQSAA